MKGGKYAKTLAKIQVRGIFRIQDIRRNVLPKFIEICWRRPAGAHPDTAISRRVVGKSTRDNPERHCGWFWVHFSTKKFERGAREAMNICLWVLKESNKLGTVYWSYPILPFGIVACTFFATTFLEIAVYQHQHGGRKPPETCVTEFWYKRVNYSSNERTHKHQSNTFCVCCSRYFFSTYALSLKAGCFLIQTEFWSDRKHFIFVLIFLYYMFFSRF